MNSRIRSRTRRAFLSTMTFGAAAFTTRGLFAEELFRTPRQTEGPFYPNKLPLDTDNDLIDHQRRHHAGRRRDHPPDRRILDAQGNPVRNALVEIWQVDNNGVYIHTRTPDATSTTRTSRATADSSPGRPASTSSAPSSRSPTPAGPATSTSRSARPSKELLTTQCYVKGEPLNERDGVFRGIKDPKAREALTIDFNPLEGSRIGELQARFDIILGYTPEA